MDSLILIGGGGHCESCIDVIEQEGRFEIAGIVDLPEKIGSRVAGCEVIADDSRLEALAGTYDAFLVTLGQIQSAEKRQTIFENLLQLNVRIPSIVSPRAYVSGRAKIGAGTVVHHHAVINSGARIGRNCIINTAALVEHHAVVGDHAHVSTGAILNGASSVGNRSFIGSGAILRESISVGDSCMVSAGARVMKPMEPGSTNREL